MSAGALAQRPTGAVTACSLVVASFRRGARAVAIVVAGIGALIASAIVGLPALLLS